MFHFDANYGAQLAEIDKGAPLLALNRGPEAIAGFDRTISLNRGDSSTGNNRGYALCFMFHEPIRRRIAPPGRGAASDKR